MAARAAASGGMPPGKRRPRDPCRAALRLRGGAAVDPPPRRPPAQRHRRQRRAADLLRTRAGGDRGPLAARTGDAPGRGALASLAALSAAGAGRPAPRRTDPRGARARSPADVAVVATLVAHARATARG